MPSLDIIAGRKGFFGFSEWAVRHAQGIDEESCMSFTCEGQEGIRSWHDPEIFPEVIAESSAEEMPEHSTEALSVPGSVVCTLSSEGLWIATVPTSTSKPRMTRAMSPI